MSCHPKAKVSLGRVSARQRIGRCGNARFSSGSGHIIQPVKVYPSYRYRETVLASVSYPPQDDIRGSKCNSPYLQDVTATSGSLTGGEERPISACSPVLLVPVLELIACAPLSSPVDTIARLDRTRLEDDGCDHPSRQQCNEPRNSGHGFGSSGLYEASCLHVYKMCPLLLIAR